MIAYNLTHEAQLRNFTQIDVKIDTEYGIVWIYMKPSPRPCFNPLLVAEVRAVQLILESYNGKFPHKGDLVPIEYLVLDSRMHGIFSLGGDLNLFRDHIMRKDKEGFLKYVKVCMDTIHDLITGCRLPITTISLVRGDALGGGFEVALSCQVLIAEQQIEMGFPEVLFNLFPGMGSYHLLSQRIPPKQVEKMMLNGRKYPAQELYDMGVVDKIADEGQGEQAVYSYITESSKYRNAHLALKNVREKIHPISYESLMEIATYWVEISMNISDRDLRLMERLIRAQNKLVNQQEEAAEPGYQELYKENIA